MGTKLDEQDRKELQVMGRALKLLDDMSITSKRWLRDRLDEQIRQAAA